MNFTTEELRKALEETFCIVCGLKECDQINHTYWPLYPPLPPAPELAAEVIRLRDKVGKVSEAIAGGEALLPENGAAPPETRAEARTDEARRMVLEPIRAALREGGE